MTVHVTNHAIERYRERVADIPDVDIIEALNSPTIRQAADIGACSVKLGTGQHAVILNGTVITVLPKFARPFPKERYDGVCT